MSFTIIKLTSMPDGSFEEMDSDRKWMRVPRCDSCRLWTRPDPNQDGICTLWKGNRIVVTTSADYGCVRWEGK